MHGPQELNGKRQKISWKERQTVVGICHYSFPFWQLVYLEGELCSTGYPWVVLTMCSFSKPGFKMNGEESKNV